MEADVWWMADVVYLVVLSAENKGLLIGWYIRKDEKQTAVQLVPLYLKTDYVDRNTSASASVHQQWA